jgi:hypothetical protein
MEVALADGSKVPLWNTFKDQQVCQLLCCQWQQALVSLTIK